MATQTLEGIHYGGESRIAATLRHYRLQIAGVAIAVLALVVLAAAIVYGIRALASSPYDIWLGSPAQLTADMPLMLFTTLFTLTLIPGTYGLTLVVMGAIVAVVLPFICEQQHDREIRQQMSHEFGAYDHDHIPESGYNVD